MTAFIQSRRCAPAIRAASGFTLVEIAVGIFIIALLLGSILVPLTTQVESRKYEETQRLLDQVREALLGYAAANGRFPCPASTTSNGVESFAVGGNASNGSCSNFTSNSFLPAVTLGLTPTDAQGYALDAWGLAQNRIRYAVSNTTVNSITNPFTRTDGIRNATMSAVSTANLLDVCAEGAGVGASNCGSETTLVSTAIVVIWSLGPNAATGGTSVNEAENVDNDGVFVLRVKSEVAGAAFDDSMTWIAPPLVFNRLLAAGRLP